MTAPGMYGLVDGNNFYVSCETVFRPSLNGVPVIVLSNNDGCAVSRSNEAKALGVQMGQPWFQCRDLEKSDGLIALSSNYALYGDMSNRIMTTASEYAPKQEIYSIGLIPKRAIDVFTAGVSPVDNWIRPSMCSPTSLHSYYEAGLCAIHDRRSGDCARTGSTIESRRYPSTI